MEEPKLFMLLLGCRPKGRFIEQHDVFFGIGYRLKDLVPYLHDFWPEAKGNLHIDAWREVTLIDGYRLRVIPRTGAPASLKLFFLNLGGYKSHEFDEYHYKLLTVAPQLEQAVQAAKQSLFYKHTGFKGAPAHVDDTYGLDVDEVFEVRDILPPDFRARYSLELVAAADAVPDVVHLGYLPLYKV